MRNFFSILWQHKFIFLAIMLAGIFSVHLITNLSLHYTAKSVLIVEPDPAVQNTDLADRSFYATQRVLKSRALAGTVVQRLNLWADPEFNSKYTQKSLTPIEAERVVSNVLGVLEVNPVGERMGLEIAFTSENPEKAAAISNAIADIVVRQHIEYQAAASMRLTSRLESYLAKIRRDLRKSERDLATYTQSLIVPEKEDKKPAKQKPQLSDDLANIQSDLLLAKSQLAQLNMRTKMIADLGDIDMQIEDMLEFPDNDEVKAFNEEKQTLAQKREDLSKRYGEKHPEMIAIAESEAALKRKAQDHIKALKSKTQSTISKTKTKIQGLEKKLQDIQPAAAPDEPESPPQKLEPKPAEQAARIKELERAVQANQMLFAYFLKNYRLEEELAKIRSPNIRVLYYAETPTTPTYPKHALILLIGGLFSFAAAWGLVILISRLFSPKSPFHSINMNV